MPNLPIDKATERKHTRQTVPKLPALDPGPGEDNSATPVGLIAHAIREKAVVIVDPLPVFEQNIVIDYIFSQFWREHTPYTRFVKWRQPVCGRRYGFIRAA